HPPLLVVVGEHQGIVRVAPPAPVHHGAGRYNEPPTRPVRSMSEGRPRIEHVFDQRNFVHLSVRSNFSLKDGAFFPEQLAMAAADLGMPAVALTDRDGLYGAARFVDGCAKAGVRPILGATLTIREGRTLLESRAPTDASIVVLARNAEGYANLCRLITDAHMTGERGDPSLAPAQVLAHADGLVCLLGPESPAGRLALHGLHDAAME